MMGRDIDLRVLRDDIDQGMTEATNTLNELLRDQFEALGVKYEQATWDAARSTLGKPKKLKITREHIDAQTPFHWGYMFDGIMQKQGGFDIILTNPPWEIFKPQAKEFFADHSELVSKNKMTIKEFEKEQGKLLKDKAVREAWLAYESRFPHMSAWFRAAPEYRAQSAVVNGKKTGSDLNLYKLFLERCYACCAREAIAASSFPVAFTPTSVPRACAICCSITAALKACSALRTARRFSRVSTAASSSSC